MQNEILKPVLATDESAVPRYDIVSPTGSVLQQNVELRLKNEVMQEGTPYDEDSVLPAELATQLGLPATATPAQAFQKLATLAKSSSIGDMKDTVNTDLGDSWLLCNGDVVNRAEYPELYSILEQAGITGYHNLDLEVTPAATNVAMGVANGTPWFTGCARALNNGYTVNVKLVYFSVEDASFHTVMLTYTATGRTFYSSLVAKVCGVDDEYLVAVLPVQDSNTSYSVVDARNTITWFTSDLGGEWESSYLTVSNNNTLECFYDLVSVKGYFVLTCGVGRTESNTSLVMYAKTPNTSTWTKYTVEPNAQYSNGTFIIREVVCSNGYFGVLALRNVNGSISNYWFYTPVGTTTFTQLQTQDDEGSRTDCNLNNVLGGSNFLMKENADGSLFFVGKGRSQYGYYNLRYVQVADPTFGADANGYISSIRTSFTNSSAMTSDVNTFPLEVNGMYVLLYHGYSSSGSSSTNNVSRIAYKSMTDAPTGQFATPSGQFFPYGREFYDSCIYEDGKYYIFGTDSNNTLLTKYGADLANIVSTATIANDVGRGGTNNVVKVGDYYYVVTTGGANDTRVKVHYTKTVGGMWTTESLPNTEGYSLRTSTLFNDGTNVIICTSMTANTIKFYKTFYRPLDGSADWQCMENIIVQQASERGGCYYYVLNGTTYENYVCVSLGRPASRLSDSTKVLTFSDLSSLWAYQVDTTVPQMNVSESFVGYSKLPMVSHVDHYTYIKAKEDN